MIGMDELWQNVDRIIETFVSESRTDEAGETCSKKAVILWKNPILYSKWGFILRGSKTIISVPSVSFADDLEKKLRNRLSEKDLLIRDAVSRKERPFKLLIKKIACPKDGGQLILKKLEIPVTNHGVSGYEIFGLIETQRRRALERIDNSLETERIEINEMFDRIEKNVRSEINANKKYCTHQKKPYAMSYRVTFNDVETKRRRQTAVGDVLIVVNGLNVITDQRLTQTRSDKFELKNSEKYICSVGDIGIYIEK